MGRCINPDLQVGCMIAMYPIYLLTSCVDYIGFSYYMSFAWYQKVISSNGENI